MKRFKKIGATFSLPTQEKKYDATIGARGYNVRQLQHAARAEAENERRKEKMVTPFAFIILFSFLFFTIFSIYLILVSFY